MKIPVKKPQHIDIMRQNGRCLALILDELKSAVRPGISAGKLELLTQKLIKRYGGKPSFLGFDNYPCALCCSLNEEIVHALPRQDKIIQQGDLVSLDLGFYKNGFHADCALSFTAGESFPKKHNDIIQATQEALQKSISIIKPGIELSEVSAIIEKIITNAGFSVIEDLTGHGIGENLHEDPYVFNCVLPEEKTARIRLKEGMVLAIEPMSSAGSGKIKEGGDGYAYVTKDGSISCHFEHTIAVTSSGAKILTVK